MGRWEGYYFLLAKQQNADEAQTQRLREKKTYERRSDCEEQTEPEPPI